MAQVITNSDINNPNQQNQNPNQVTTNQANSNQNNANQQAMGQIAQNYGATNQPSGPQSGPQTATNVPQANAPANPNAQKGTGFTNIQSIIQANQGNKLGSTIGQGIQQAGQQAQQATQNAQQQFQQQSQANQANTSANAQLVQNALANPSSVTNPSQVSQFQNLMSGSYQGPTGLANAGQLQAQAQDVNQLNQATTNAGGQQGLLQRFVGNPQYTAGEQNLDALLLGATGGNALAQARQATAGTLSQEQQAQTGATQAAQQYANQAQQFGQNVQQQFGNTVNQQQQALTQQAQNQQQLANTNFANLQSQLAQGNISQNIANQLGITNGAYNYGVTPGQFVTQNAQQATAQNAATAQQYAQMQALAQLGGQSAPGAAQQVLSQYGNPTQAGTFNAANDYNVNSPAFQQALSQGQTGYQQAVAAINPAQQAYNNAAAIGTGGGSFGMGINGGSLNAALLPTSDVNNPLNENYNWNNAVGPSYNSAFVAQAQQAQSALRAAQAAALAQQGQQFNVIPNTPVSTNGS